MQDMASGDNNRTPAIFQVPDNLVFVGDSFAEAPRAKPFGLARLPKIYLQERYQVSTVVGGLKGNY